jgi:hypothetical protein
MAYWRLGMRAGCLCKSIADARWGVIVRQRRWALGALIFVAPAVEAAAAR